MGIENVSMTVLSPKATNAQSYYDVFGDWFFCCFFNHLPRFSMLFYSSFEYFCFKFMPIIMLLTKEQT